MTDPLTYNFWWDGPFVEQYNKHIYGQEDDAEDSGGNEKVDIAQNVKVIAVQISVS